MDDWNKWAEQNKDNKKFKAKKYKPRVKSLNMDEDLGGIEAMRFLHMYRNRHRGEIGDKLDLFREFFQQKETIKRQVFYRLAAIWLQRQTFEMATGRKYIEQDYVYKKLER